MYGEHERVGHISFWRPPTHCICEWHLEDRTYKKLKPYLYVGRYISIVFTLLSEYAKVLFDNREVPIELMCFFDFILHFYSVQSVEINA